jgi:hypothetical protein
MTSGGQIFYHVMFKDPLNHPALTIRDDGHVMQ